MEGCESITGLTVDGKPEVCGKPGIRVGSIVKCKEHWASGRSQRHRRAPGFARREQSKE